MNKIYKYPLGVLETQTLDLPEGAQIIRVDTVDGKLFLWAIVNTAPDVKEVTRYLEFYKTGQAFTSKISDLNYLGSCRLYIMQELMLYVFENIAKTYGPPAK